MDNDKEAESSGKETPTVSILLVDDQSSGLIALEAILAVPEYNLVKANSGHEALRFLLEDDFALILLDVRMPDMDGFETAEIIKTNQRTKDIPIIFITGMDDDVHYVYKGYEAGAVDYLLKPFDKDILRSKVNIFIELFKKNRTIQRQAELLRQNDLARLELENLKRYQTLADAIPHLVWEIKPEGSLGYLNKAWYDYTQLTPEQSKGIVWQSIIHPAEKDTLVLAWQTAIKTKKGFEIECRIKRGSDSQYRWHLVRMVPRENREGQLDVWLGTATDIHDRRKAENKIRKAIRVARDAAKIKSDFLAVMSHEIRTPLNSVLGMTGLLLDTHQTVQQKDYSEVIRRSGESLLAIINDILDFSKVESGKMELEIIDFNLKQLIEDCEKSFSFMFEKKGIVFSVEIPESESLNLKGDSGRLLQVLNNLVNNAIKFTTKGRISLHVSILQKVNKRVQLRFDVRDSGIGIPQEAIDRLFQVFSQVDSSTTRRFGGTGLGLAICKRLIELMGGKMGVLSHEGEGSTFWFILELEESNVTLPKVALKAEANSQHKAKNCRILVAEDNTANQLVLARMLEKLGYRAEVVGNGNEVLDALRDIHYDVILMDWHMPEMDGCEATKIIRENKGIGLLDVPIIAMTANVMKGDREKCLKAGMNDYISKPISLDLLAQKLEEWVPK